MTNPTAHRLLARLDLMKLQTHPAAQRGLQRGTITLLVCGEYQKTILCFWDAFAAVDPTRQHLHLTLQPETDENT